MVSFGDSGPPSGGWTGDIRQNHLQDDDDKAPVQLAPGDSSWDYRWYYFPLLHTVARYGWLDVALVKLLNVVDIDGDYDEWVRDAESSAIVHPMYREMFWQKDGCILLSPVGQTVVERLRSSALLNFRVDRVTELSFSDLMTFLLIEPDACEHYKLLYGYDRLGAGRYLPEDPDAEEDGCDGGVDDEEEEEGGGDEPDRFYSFMVVFVIPLRHMKKMARSRDHRAAAIAQFRLSRGV